jgi:hypothetical protein
MTGAISTPHVDAILMTHACPYTSIHAHFSFRGQLKLTCQLQHQTADRAIRMPSAPTPNGFGATQTVNTLLH